MNMVYSDNKLSIRENSLDVWLDLFLYAQNLSGNWMTSREIFFNCIVPTAERNPQLFAKWVNSMVRVSGLKIKHRSAFYGSLSTLRKFKGKNDYEVRKALTNLIASGLEEPDYAKNALEGILQEK